MDKQELFIRDLQKLLECHDAIITAEDHWEGYAECGKDIRMTVEFENDPVTPIDLGGSIDKDIKIHIQL